MSHDKRKQTSFLSVALLAATALILSGCAQLRAVAPDETGEVVFTLTDNRISPSVVEVEAGQTVRFIVVNEGRHAHEFMVGRDPVAFEHYLEDPVYEAFQVDFFEGLDVQVSGSGMAMNFAGMAEMDMGDDGHADEGDMDMGDEEHADEGDMDMGDEEHADEGDMDMGDEEHADEGDMDMGDDEHADEGGEAGHGAMVMFQPGPLDDPSQPGQSAVIEFVVPEDSVGTWQIACFEEDGQHFADGMHATLIVNS